MNVFRKIALFILLLGAFVLESKAQTDTLFWFVAPDVGDGGGKFDLPIVFRFSSLNSPAKVTLDIPANPSFTPITINLSANTTQSLDLSTNLNLIENRPPNQILNKGIRIRATSLISAYYEIVSSYCNCSPEIFTLKGQKALGTKFYTPFQDTFRNGGPYSYSPVPYSAIEVVATEDNTLVSISPTKDIVGHSGGSTFNITLNKGQTYSATATSILGPNHLGGSKVVSNKPIAVTVKDDLIGFGLCADLAGDQLISVDYIGNEYIAMKGFLDIPDRVYILAVEDNTKVFINSAFVAALNEGEQYCYRLASGSIYIKSSKDVYAMHLTGYTCEIGAAILPPINCTGSFQVGFTRSSSNNFYLLLMVENGGQSNFTLNGSTTVINAGVFNDVPSTGGQWKYANLSLNTSQVPVNTASLISNSTHRFHMGMLNGLAGVGVRYGYFSDYGRYMKNVSAEKTILCEGDTIRLYGQTLDTNTISWKGPNGFTSNQLNIVIPNVSTTHAGYYVFTTSAPACGSGKDSVYISIASKPIKPTVSSNLPVCLGQKLILKITNKPGFAHTVSWDKGAKRAIGIDDSLVFYPTFQSDEAVYSVQYRSVSNGCLSDTAQIKVSLLPLPDKPFISSAATKYCEFDQVVISNVSTVPLSTQFSWKGEHGFSSNLRNKIDIDSIRTGQSGWYKLTLIDSNGCKNESDLLYIDVIAYPDLSNVSIGSNSPICSGGPLHLKALNIDSGLAVKWKGPSGFSSTLTNILIQNTTIAMSGIYKLSVSRDICELSDTLQTAVLVKQTTHADFDFSVAIARVGRNVHFINKSAFAAAYEWDFGDFTEHSPEINPNHIYEREERLYVTLFAYNTDSTCIDTSIKRLDVYNSEEGVYVPSAFSPNNDGKNDIFKVIATGVKFEITLEVYNRWGGLIFITEDARNVGWDGTNSGIPCQEGVYMYIVRYTSLEDQPVVTSGTVTLLR